MLERLGCRRKALAAGRNHSAQVPAQDKDDGLIERDPEAHVRQRGADSLRQAAEPADALRMLPAAVLQKPAGMGVVMQRDDRLDSQTRQVLRSLRLELESGFVELASLWLDAAPFDRIPVGVGPDRRQQGEVGSP